MAFQRGRRRVLQRCSCIVAACLVLDLRSLLALFSHRCSAHAHHALPTTFEPAIWAHVGAGLLPGATSLQIDAQLFGPSSPPRLRRAGGVASCLRLRSTSVVRRRGRLSPFQHAGSRGQIRALSTSRHLSSEAQVVNRRAEDSVASSPWRVLLASLEIRPSRMPVSVPQTGVRSKPIKANEDKETTHTHKHASKEAIKQTSQKSSLTHRK